MAPYLIVFGSFLAVYFRLETTANGGTLTLSERWGLLLPLMIFAGVYAGRIGTDADHYHYLFNMANEFPLEPGFSVLMIGAKKIGLHFIGFARLLAVTQIVLLALIVKRLRDPLFFLLFYISTVYVDFEFNVVRNALALLVIGVFYVRRRRAGIMALALSWPIHYSSPVTVGLQWLASRRRQILPVVGFAAAAGLFAALWFHPTLAGGRLGDLLTVYEGYLDQKFPSKIIYPALLLKLAVVWIFYRNGGNRFYLSIYAILVLMVHLISPILNRVCDLVLFLALLDFCMERRLGRYRLTAIALTLILVVSSLLIPWRDCQNANRANWCLSAVASS